MEANRNSGREYSLPIYFLATRLSSGDDITAVEFIFMQIRAHEVIATDALRRVARRRDGSCTQCRALPASHRITFPMPGLSRD